MIGTMLPRAAPLLLELVELVEPVDDPEFVVVPLVADEVATEVVDEVVVTSN